MGDVDRGETFGAQLRVWREMRGLSLRDLAALAHYSKSQISDLERGIRPPRIDVADHLDSVLEADGELRNLAPTNPVRPIDHPNPLDPRSYTNLAVQLLAAGGDADMLDRRSFLSLSGATSLGALAPGLAMEATRHGLTLSLAEQRATTAIDEWHEIAWQYGYDYMALPARELLHSLMIDMLGLQVAMDRQPAPGDHAYGELARVGGTLAALMAMTVANLGDVHHARRWWRTARQLADQSSHIPTILWVRGREAIRAMYEGRPAPMILRMIDSAQPFVEQAAPADLPELLSAKAQAAAMAGRHADAEAALRDVRVIYDGLPAEVLEDRDSIYGWPENRLRFTESYVYSHLGDSARAAAAQDRAVTLYPGSYRRGPVQIELQRALCMVSDGDVTGGTHHAANALQSLPGGYQIRPIVSLANSVLGAVPSRELARPAVRDFQEHLALATA